MYSLSMLLPHTFFCFDHHLLINNIFDNSLNVKFTIYSKNEIYNFYQPINCYTWKSNILKIFRQILQKVYFLPFLENDFNKCKYQVRILNIKRGLISLNCQYYKIYLYNIIRIVNII